MGRGCPVQSQEADTVELKTLELKGFFDIIQNNSFQRRFYRMLVTHDVNRSLTKHTSLP